MVENIKIPVNISISGTHVTDNDDSETFEKYSGFYSKRSDSVYIIYEDKNRCRNMIKVTENKAELKRTFSKDKKSNDTPARLEMADFIYIRGERTEGFYRTTYGILDIEILTEDIKQEELIDIFKLNIKGNIKMNGSPVSDFVLKIEAAAL